MAMLSVTCKDRTLKARFLHKGYVGLGTLIGLLINANQLITAPRRSPTEFWICDREKDAP